jgi:hypothetical protein
MATYTWTLQGSTPTTIDATDLLQFAGSGGFDDPITVSSYNDTTHVESSVGANDSSGNTPHNNKFISQSGGTGGDSQADWGDGTEDIDAITDAECTLEINFSHGSAVAVSAHTIYADDGTTPTNGPTDVDFRIAESGDTNFTEAEGSGSAMSVTDSGSATSHDFYFLVSASPTAVGEKTAFRLVDALTYT